jgi:hypothetical protein
LNLLSTLDVAAALHQSHSPDGYKLGPHLLVEDSHFQCSAAALNRLEPVTEVQKGDGQHQPQAAVCRAGGQRVAGQGGASLVVA